MLKLYEALHINHTQSNLEEKGKPTIAIKWEEWYQMDENVINAQVVSKHLKNRFSYKIYILFLASLGIGFRYKKYTLANVTCPNDIFATVWYSVVIMKLMVLSISVLSLYSMTMGVINKDC